MCLTVFLAKSLAAWQPLGVLPPPAKNVRRPDKDYNEVLGGPAHGERAAGCLPALGVPSLAPCTCLEV